MFLFKPHVVGPKGNITTPDVIVDCLIVDNHRRAIGLLTCECWQQVDAGTSATPAYALMALGGGALISPALCLSSGWVVVARKAWRLANLEGHSGTLKLNGQALAEIDAPEQLIVSAGGTGDVLPRGYMVVRTVNASSTDVQMEDPVLNRTLSHRVVFTLLDEDRWGNDRPRPRYSVGPTTRDVTHFI